jgi:uncharacterized protein (TIGR02145 family)/uncharacterized repeat protein (TIGR02543 family)
VTFNPNGGTVSPTSDTTGADGKLDSLPTPTREGYIFNGWFTALTGGAEVAANKVYTADTTIYARWVAVYTVTFAPNGGTVDPTSAKTGIGGKLNSLPTPKRDYYTFNGWYIGELRITSSMVYSKDTTIFAWWTATPTPTKTTFVDSRDGKVYNKVSIGGQIGMAQNLNFVTEGGSMCPRDGCTKYGRLYNWTTAMDGASSSSASPSGVQGVCPVGWHLPSGAEWNTLMRFVYKPENGASTLQAKNEWGRCGTLDSPKCPTDDYGFSALPGGVREDGSFSGAGDYGGWWSSTADGGETATSAFVSYYGGYGYSDWDGRDKANLISVRCVQD